MLNIKLKDKSPEYLDEIKPEPAEYVCDHPGCDYEGDCRAPKARDLQEYYHFCQEHAREYNKRWNFFSGMSESEIEDYIYNQTIWDRPTWRFADQVQMENKLRDRIRRSFFDEEDEPQFDSQKEYREKVFRNAGTPEVEALAVMGLEPPITLDGIKAKYKELAKKHHPDRNGGSKEAEEHFKKISVAYTVLKVAYESFEKLEEAFE